MKNQRTMFFLIVLSTYSLVFFHGVWFVEGSCLLDECDEKQLFWRISGGVVDGSRYDKTTAKGLMRSSSPLKGTREQHQAELVLKRICKTTKNDCINLVSANGSYYPASFSEDIETEASLPVRRYFCADGTPLEGVMGSWNEGKDKYGNQ